MKQLIFICLSFSLLCCKCKKDKPVEPPKPEPQDMIYATINGKEWESCKPGYLGGTVSYTTVQNFPGNYFDVSGANICSGTTNKDIYLYIKIFGSIKKGNKFQLGGTSPNMAVVSGPQLDSNSLSIKYPTDSIHTGMLEITDTLYGLSGTFYFDGFNKDSNKVVKVTNGRMYQLYVY